MLIEQIFRAAYREGQQLMLKGNIAGAMESFEKAFAAALVKVVH